MNTLNDIELMDVEGGFVWPLIQAYKELLIKIEQNPQEYTWLMDWYYEQN